MHTQFTLSISHYCWLLDRDDVLTVTNYVIYPAVQQDIAVIAEVGYVSCA